MKNDIQNREDIYIIVSHFYKKLLINKDMRHFFAKFDQEDKLEHHLQTLVDFWDNVLFYSGTYEKNAMQPHIDLHRKKSFKKTHFEIWLNLFNESVDHNFKGENAHTIKARALSIATVMRIKTINS
jgi:hemoglobin